MNRVIYACDIGSIRAGHFAWARVVPGQGTPHVSRSIDHLVTQLSEDAYEGSKSIAIGFESPPFMPVPAGSASLGHGRENEGNRSMFAAVGASVTTLGIHEAVWILRALRDTTHSRLQYTFDWTLWPRNVEAPYLPVWEAFVAGAAHGRAHICDAATAAMFFSDNENDLGRVNAVDAERPLCLIHAVALWANWSAELSGFNGNCLVLKPEHAYEGDIDRGQDSRDGVAN